MDHNALMLECLKLATEQGYKGEEARHEARKMFNQITGRSDDAVPAPKARVVGRDGDMEPPFKDYVKE